jgi:hypothetical protein
MVDYCTESDLYEHGLPRGSVSNPARLIASGSIAANALELDGHGFAEGDAVQFRAEAEGSLPSPLVAGVIYYASPVGAFSFSVKATPTGGVINLATTGAGVLVFTELPIAAAIEWATRTIDEMLPAHVVPLEAPIPAMVRITAGELAAGKLAAYGGSADKALTSILDAAQVRLARWAKSIPLRGDNVPVAATLAVVSTAAPNAWTTYGGL